MTDIILSRRKARASAGSDTSQHPREIKSEFFMPSRRHHPQVEPLLATCILQSYQLVAKYSLQPSRNKFNPENCWCLKSVGEILNYWLVLYTLHLLCLWCPVKILIQHCCILLLFPLPFFHLSFVSSNLISSIKNPSNPFISLIPPSISFPKVKNPLFDLSEPFSSCKNH